MVSSEAQNPVLSLLASVTMSVSLVLMQERMWARRVCQNLFLYPPPFHMGRENFLCADSGFKRAVAVTENLNNRVAETRDEGADQAPGLDAGWCHCRQQPYVGSA